MYSSSSGRTVIATDHCHAIPLSSPWKHYVFSNTFKFFLIFSLLYSKPTSRRRPSILSSAASPGNNSGNLIYICFLNKSNSLNVTLNKYHASNFLKIRHQSLTHYVIICGLFLKSLTLNTFFHSLRFVIILSKPVLLTTFPFMNSPLEKKKQKSRINMNNERTCNSKKFSAIIL